MVKGYNYARYSELETKKRYSRIFFRAAISWKIPAHSSVYIYCVFAASVFRSGNGAFDHFAWNRHPSKWCFLVPSAIYQSHQKTSGAWICLLRNEIRIQHASDYDGWIWYLDTHTTDISENCCIKPLCVFCSASTGC